MSAPAQLRSSTVSDVVRRAAATFGDRPLLELPLAFGRPAGYANRKPS